MFVYILLLFYIVSAFLCEINVIIIITLYTVRKTAVSLVQEAHPTWAGNFSGLNVSQKINCTEVLQADRTRTEFRSGSKTALTGLNCTPQTEASAAATATDMAAMTVADTHTRHDWD